MQRTKDRANEESGNAGCDTTDGSLKKTRFRRAGENEEGGYQKKRTGRKGVSTPKKWKNWDGKSKKMEGFGGKGI